MAPHGERSGRSASGSTRQVRNRSEVARRARARAGAGKLAHETGHLLGINPGCSLAAEGHGNCLGRFRIRSW